MAFIHQHKFEHSFQSELCLNSLFPCSIIRYITYDLIHSHKNHHFLNEFISDGTF